MRETPAVTSIEYDFASTCDGGKTYNKIPGKTVNITFHEIDKQKTRLYGSKSGTAVINIDVEKDKTCEYALLVSFVEPSGKGSYTLAGPGGKGFERGVGNAPKVFVKKTGKEADPEFRLLEYDMVSGNFTGKKEEGADPGVIKKHSKKETIKAAAYEKMSFIQESVGKGAANLKDFAFYGAMWPLSQSGVSLVKKLGEPGFAEVWLVKIPVTVEIEGDFKIAEHGAYEVKYDPWVIYYVALDPNYQNTVGRITLSGFPPTIGPAHAERISNSAGDGAPGGDALKTVMTFRDAKAAGNKVSYNYHVENWRIPSGKKEFAKVSEADGASYSFSVDIGAYNMEGMKRYEEPREVKIRASSLEFKDAGAATFTAVVTGVKPDEEPVAYQWSGVSASKGNKAELKVTEDGEFTVSCAVVSAAGGPIGSDSVKVKSELNAKKAKEKVEEAKKLAAEGKLDEAIARAGEAAKLDPKNPDAGPLAEKLKDEKARVLGHLEKMNGFVHAENFGEAQREFDAAKSMHPKYPPVVEAGKLLTEKKGAYDKKVGSSNESLEKAKKEAHIGKLDESIASAESALKINPKNQAASDFIRHIQSEKTNVAQGLDSVRKIMAENRFADAQNALIPIKNKYPYYPPIQDMDRELGDKWRAYSNQVRDKVYEVRSANEKKDFGKALEIAAAWRASTKLDPYAEKELKQQEDWARQWKAQKDKQIGVLKAAGEKVKNYDYAGALKTYDEGFANGQNLYNGSEPEYKEAVELRGQAFTKNKRLGELTPHIRDAAENKDSYYGQKHVLDGALKAADEAIALQPVNGQLKTWRAMIVARAEKTKADNDRTAQGRKYLDAAGGAERGFLTNESAIQARQIQWNENVEVQQHRYLTAAIENYTGESEIHSRCERGEEDQGSSGNTRGPEEVPRKLPAFRCAQERGRGPGISGVQGARVREEPADVRPGHREIPQEPLAASASQRRNDGAADVEPRVRQA